MTGLVKIDVRRMVFPVIAGHPSPEGFRRTGVAGTGFFIGKRGLALTAAHVITNLASGSELRVALPVHEGRSPMTAYEIAWSVCLPGSDIAVMRVGVAEAACFPLAFDSLASGQDVETTAVAMSLSETDASGRTRVALRCAKGYVSHGGLGWIAASFALPKGMSGAPLIANIGADEFVTGVFVGQMRGEEIEDLVEEVVDAGPGERRTHTERVARVEYFARGELLQPHKDFSSPAFEGLPFWELVRRDVAD
jgi:hypothetical protein